VDFLSKNSDSVRTNSGPTQLHIQLPQGALSPGVNRPGSETNRSPPSNDGVWNVWNHDSFPIRFHGVMLNEAQRKTHLYLFCVKGRDHLGDLNTVGRKILKIIVSKQDHITDVKTF
jgi:hypothetical protein